jgi:dephospho-CoA kinase
LISVIEAAFPGTTGVSGVDRVKLGGMVFGNDDALRQLEAIVHPAVAEERAVFLASNASAPMVTFDIPLLFEKGGDARMDAVVVVSAPAEVQRARVLARPGMTLEKFEQILARQTPDAEKRERADFVIETGTSIDVTRARVDEVIACLTGSEGR